MAAVQEFAQQRSNKPLYYDIRRVRSHQYPNDWDLCLQGEVDLLRGIENHGGLKKVCCRNTYDDPESVAPWRGMPTAGIPFEKTESLLISDLTINTDTPVLQFRVPEGFDGICESVVNLMIPGSGGGSFDEGSGELAWRIAFLWSTVSTVLYYANDYGNILTTLGSLTNRYELSGGGIRLYSNQDITYLVNQSDMDLDPTARILCSMRGYWYPRR